MQAKTVFVCCDTGCAANGGDEVAAALKLRLSDGVELKVESNIKKTGCHGFCEYGPIIRIMPLDLSYYRVKPEDIDEIVEKSVVGNEVIERLLYKTPDGTVVRTTAENPFYIPQKKVALRNVGEIDPLDIDDFLARDGYQALKKAISLSGDEIIAEVEKSGLRGRGGAGFPTGRKWRQCSKYQSFPKYVVCNCDEGDPGAFMDRGILEGDPHCVLEGMAICARAIGAREGFIYVRDEYELTVQHAREAIDAARKHGYLGENILGSDFCFDVEVVRGGGAFVCGESTALMASIEGKVGEPRAKYIRSVEKGLFGQPTVLNNVETFSNIPVIIQNGSGSFRKIGTEFSPGTKVFTLVGKVKRTGLVEVPMGITLRDLIFGIGGGIIGDRPFKAVQTGGPSGGCIPESLLDVQVDFDTLTKYGSMMGSGGMIVMDDRTCMVEIARYYIDFLTGESCGKCTPCREGLRRLSTILTDICEGRGKPSDIPLIEETCETIAEAALCGLGKSAPNPVITTLTHFREEYEEHINDKRCRAGICQSLSTFEIDAEKCTGCGACRKNCPAAAITGESKKAHEIKQELCVKCGTCRDVCKFEAVNTMGWKHGNNN